MQAKKPQKALRMRRTTRCIRLRPGASRSMFSVDTKVSSSRLERLGVLVAGVLPRELRTGDRPRAAVLTSLHTMAAEIIQLTINSIMTVTPASPACKCCCPQLPNTAGD